LIRAVAQHTLISPIFLIGQSRKKMKESRQKNPKAPLPSFGTQLKK
jgi:hypothetical protein